MAVRNVPVPRPTPPEPGARRAAIDTLAQALTAAAARGGRALAASDGSVAGRRQRLKRAGWAVAVQLPDVPPAVASGAVASLDTSSAMAEREAAKVLLQAAVRAQVRFDVYIDNKGVQQGLAEALRGCPRPQAYGFGDWDEIARLAQQLPDGCAAHWVPSHGKRANDWAPATDHTSAVVRALNQVADEACGAESQALHERLSSRDVETHAAADSAMSAGMRRLAEGEQWVIEDFMPRDVDPDMGLRRQRRAPGRGGCPPASATAAAAAPEVAASAASDPA